MILGVGGQEVGEGAVVERRTATTGRSALANAVDRLTTRAAVCHHHRQASHEAAAVDAGLTGHQHALPRA